MENNEIQAEDITALKVNKIQNHLRTFIVSCLCQVFWIHFKIFNSFVYHSYQLIWELIHICSYKIVICNLHNRLLFIINYSLFILYYCSFCVSLIFSLLAYLFYLCKFISILRGYFPYRMVGTYLSTTELWTYS